MFKLRNSILKSNIFQITKVLKQMVFFKDNRNLNKLGKRTKLEINVFALNIDFINLKRKNKESL